MGTPAEFREFVTEAAREAADFHGDEVELAARVGDGDSAALAELMGAYGALAVLTGLRLRSSRLSAPDAAQEAMLVLRNLIEAGSTTIALDLPSAVQATFERLKKAPGSG